MMSYDLGLADKTAFVTGGASGIGEVVCRTLAALGTNVVIADRDLEGARRLTEDLKTLAQSAFAVEVDVRERNSVRDAVRQTVDHFGGLDLAVNNAGIGTPRGILHEQSLQDWDMCMAVNLTGVFHCMQAEITEMLKAKKGSIVNLSSICGTIAVSHTAAYTASKHAVAGLTKTAGLDYAELGIRVNAVAPGYVDTPFLAKRPETERQALRERHPMQRMATPQEIADFIVYLLSDRASFITGSLQLIDGGYTAR